MSNNENGTQIVHFEDYPADTKSIFRTQCNERNYAWAVLVEEQSGKEVDRFK